MERHGEKRDNRRSGGKVLLMETRYRIAAEVRNCPVLFMALAALLAFGGFAKAQDNVRGGAEPVVSSIDPSKLTYDILVDGNLTQDDPGNRQVQDPAIRVCRGAGRDGGSDRR